MEWDDASFDSGYYDKDDTLRYNTLKTKTSGFLVKSTPKEIIVAMDRWVDTSGKTEYRHITTIPKKMIRKIIELKGVKICLKILKGAVGKGGGLEQ